MKLHICGKQWRNSTEEEIISPLTLDQMSIKEEVEQVAEDIQNITKVERYEHTDINIQYKNM